MDKELLDFIKDTSQALGGIQSTLVGVKDDIKELKENCKKIPKLEIGLTNHLSVHDKLSKRFIYPLSVAVGSGIILGFLHYIVKIF